MPALEATEKEVDRVQCCLSHAVFENRQGLGRRNKRAWKEECNKSERLSWGCHGYTPTFGSRTLGLNIDQS